MNPKKNKRQEKALEKQKSSTRELMNIKAITDYSLETPHHGEIVYFRVEPTNLSVLSRESVAARVYSLMTVLKGLAEIEILCMSGRESFEENKKNMERRIQLEDNPMIRSLLLADQRHLDRIQVQTATARDFSILIRIRETDKDGNLEAYLNRVEKSFGDQGFLAERAGREEIKTLLAIYFEQNVTTDRFEDFDGERWVLPF